MGYTLLDINLIVGDLLDPILGAFIAFLFFVSFLRKTRDASIYTLLNDRFGMGFLCMLLLHLSFFTFLGRV